MTVSTNAVDRPKLLVASEFFSLERGGAQRVGRLQARVVADMGLDLQLLGFFDREPNQDFGVPSRTAAGSRSAFVLRCWSSAATRSHFIYNHVGMSRAHCPLPMLRRPYAIWMLGTDVWGDRMHGDYGRRINDANSLIVDH